MDCFIGNVPPQVNAPQFEKFMRSVLSKHSIFTFEARKYKGKNFATITFLHIPEGQLFLHYYGNEQAPSRQQGPGQGFVQPGQLNRPRIQKERLRYASSPLNCKPGNQAPDDYTLKSLAMVEKKRRTQTNGKPLIENGPDARQLQSATLLCGVWDYDGLSPVFAPHALLRGPWKIHWGKRFLTFSAGGTAERRVQIAYQSIQAITAHCGSNASMTLTLQIAPTMSESIPDDILPDFSALMISNNGPKQKEDQRVRVSFLSGSPELRPPVVSTCLVYRMLLPQGLSNVQMKHLQANRDVPDAVFKHTALVNPRNNHTTAFRQLLTSLATPPFLNRIPFCCRFQVQRLAQNGYLQPEYVQKLLPVISEIVSRSGGEIAALAVRKLFSRISYAGPETEASELSHASLVSLLKENEEQAKTDISFELLSRKNSDNVAIIYRATVTPSGVYLYGPEPEANNRVLRTYSKNREDFLRVTFSDEDDQQVRYNPKMSNEKIFFDRFKNVLRDGIEIAGKKYSFLGFSHSSLRAQSCWFMAPFWDHVGSEMLHDRRVIERLGDFSNIRIPAKCAARIGQAFSESREVVTVDPKIVTEIKDVERNGRTFSDGVGTFSAEFLEYMRDSLPYGYGNWPTCFQVRYKGAKGMLSLDARLRGKQVRIRESMVKFSGSDSTDIEICGSSTRPLPMVLNRQLIKIMEDCGVEETWFMNLQRKAVQELRSTTESPHNAAYFLKTREIGTPFYLPWFIRQLNIMEMQFNEDDFLKNVVELLLLTELRQLKHRTRIPVPLGHTLYGIMDETGVLEEGEVFVITSTKPGHKHILKSSEIIVSRSPALHPGDVQVVKAVDVHLDHPLRKLSNCICFSQKGSRDLPSMLSGGDLDGDLYHIIFDPDALPTRTFSPADYARAKPTELDRKVEKTDMIDFFVTFMATDQLGRIAVLHQVIADQDPNGTMSAHCLKLADMHSTAVDYSKTGIPVDINEIPKAKQYQYRPDFMAPGPYVLKAKESISLTAEEVEEGDDEEADFTEYKYYESDKVLGKLYRDIDELKIFTEIQRTAGPRGMKRDFIDEVWQYAIRRCPSVKWNQHCDWAQEVRDMYEYDVLEIMTEYAPNHRFPLSELEVFIGQVVGKTSAQDKRHRDLSTSLKERYDNSAGYIVDQMIRDNGQPADDSLERAMACLSISLAPGQPTKNGGSLKSFQYIAAAVCLKEVDRKLQQAS